jgi:hypothetical protein
MSEPIFGDEATEISVPERPMTITLHLTAVDVELALASEGGSLRRPTMQALVLARVFDLDELELAA